MQAGEGGSRKVGDAGCWHGVVVTRYDQTLARGLPQSARTLCQGLEAAQVLIEIERRGPVVVGAK